MIYPKISSIVLIICMGLVAKAQNSTPNTIITAVPFLTIASAANSTISNIDVVGTPYSTQGVAETNPARMFESQADIVAAYTPWLRALDLQDVYLANLNGHFAINERHAVGFHAKYFSLGNIQFTDFNGNPLGSARPHEVSTGMAYAFKASDNLSLGLNLNYIYSSLARGIINGINIHHAQAFSIGFGGLYRNSFDVGLYKFDWSVGLAATNIGTRISYIDGNLGEFMPANMALGASIGAREILPNFDFFVMYQMDKLLVPTPDTLDINNNGQLDYKEKTLINAMATSFYDAPNGAKEEWQEITHSIGIEGMYHFSDRLRTGLRVGYFYESPNKGARKYWNLGGTVSFYGAYFNINWIAPNHRYTNPLDNTVSLALGYQVGI